MNDAVASVLYGVLASIALLLITERATVLSIWLVKVSAYLLPKERRLERSEQWQADIYDIQGEMWKLISAIGICAFAFTIASRTWAAVLVDRLSFRVIESASGVSARSIHAQIYTVVIPFFGKQYVALTHQCVYTTVWVVPKTSWLTKYCLRWIIARHTDSKLAEVSTRCDSNYFPAAS